MVQSCAIKTCQEVWKPGTSVTFHCFPKDPERKQKWVDAIPLELQKAFSKYSYICSKHFSADCFKDLLPKLKNKLKPTAIPTIFYCENDQSNRNESCFEESGVVLAKKNEQQFPITVSATNVPDHNKENIINNRNEKNGPNLECLKYSSKRNTKDVEVQTDPKRFKASETEENLKKKIHLLQTSIRYQKMKMNSMKQLVEQVQVYDQCRNNIEQILLENFEGFNLELIKNQLKNANAQPEGRRYTAEVKQFAMTLFFYSPKAYEFLRGTLYLPHRGMMRKWLSNYDCEPGLLQEVFDYLKTDVTQKPYLRNCSLVFDSMSLRKQIIYDKQVDKNRGYVDYGDLINTDCEELATEVLVLMIVSYTSKFKCPIGYFFINKISADSQCLVIREAILKLSEIGITVRSITCDGTRGNLKTFKLLGNAFDCTNLTNSIPHPAEYCNIQGSYSNVSESQYPIPSQSVKDEVQPGIHSNEPCSTFKTAFQHPNQNSYIYSIIDPAHVIKLCRGAFAETNISSPSGNIDFKYVEKLHELQELEDLKLANKLSYLHVNYKNKKMNVRLAAQTISSSVADAIDFLRENGNGDFVGSEATVEFLRVFDRLFDITNARNCFGRGFKSPMMLQNIEYLREIFTSSIDYISSLKIDGISVFMHARFTFALGFVVNMHSMLNLAIDLFQQKEVAIKYFLPYKCSQDHLELFFSCIRSRGGWNNNPNTLQFKWSLRQLLFNNTVKASLNANCLGDTATIPSIFKCKSSHSTDGHIKNELSTTEDVIKNLCEMIDNVHLSSIQENVLYYIAGNIVKNLCGDIDCEFCIQSLLRNNSESNHPYLININQYTSFTRFVNRGKLCFPSVGAYRIVHTAEKAFQSEIQTQPMHVKNFKRNIVTATVQTLLTSIFDLFPEHPIVESTFSEDLHEMQLVKVIADKYVNLRIHTFNKKSSIRVLGKYATQRQRLHKLILFYNV